MEIKDVLVDGKTKKVYNTDQSDQVIIEYKDTLPARYQPKKKTAKGKGELACAISAFLFEYLENYNVPTHFLRRWDKTSLEARKLDMIPITVHIWNLATNDLAGRFGLEEGQQLEYPIIEFYLKNADLNNPMINEYHAYALGLCDRKEYTNLLRIATKVNAVLKSFFDRKAMKLASLRLEFGRSNHQVVLGDDMSPDTLEVWAVNEDGSYSDPGYRGMKDLRIYQDVASRILGEK